MKRLFQIFELSKNEQRVALLVILILITIAFIGYERRVRHSPIEAALVPEPNPSPSAVETIGDQ